MMNSKKLRSVPLKTLSFFMAGMFLASATYAQLSLERQKYDSIAARYKNENAVYTNITERLVISEEEGSLVANTFVSMEKLLISNLSPSLNNTDNFSYSDFNQLTDYAAFAKIPTSKDYKTVRCNNFGEGGSGDDVFYDDYREVEVYYTGLLKNSVTETRYSLEHPDLHLLPMHIFQEGIPVVSATYEVTAPNYVNINFVLKNTDNVNIKQTKEEKNNNIIYRFTVTDLPAIKQYKHVPSIWLYSAPHIIPYIASYRLTGASKDSLILSSPDDLYRHVNLYVRNLNMKTDTGLNNTVKELTQNDMTQREKAKHIYNWVQKNIHYIAFEKGLEGFIPRAADTVYKRKYGDCKDMSSIIVAMCRKAGIDAHFVWIGTNKKPYTFEETPLMLVSNHMIAAAKIDGEWVFMDETDPTLPFGKNRDDIQGKEAMVAIDAKDYKIVTIPIEPASSNVTTDSTTINLSEYAVTGKVKIGYTGYDAWDLRMNLLYHKGEEREKLIKDITRRGTNKYIQSAYDIDISTTGNRDAVVTADFNVDGYVWKTGKECFVNMNLKRDFEDARINDADRKVPYFYDFRQRRNEVVVLNIPPGYKVKYLPKNAQGGVDGLWNYKISYKSDKKTITLTKEFELNTLAVNQKQFAANNKLVDDLKKLYKESVVLTTK